MCGHTIKSSLIHKLSVDTRDDRVLPTSGIQATLLQELAGLSPIGTAAFFKTMFSCCLSFPILRWMGRIWKNAVANSGGSVNQFEIRFFGSGEAALSINGLGSTQI